MKLIQLQWDGWTYSLLHRDSHHLSSFLWTGLSAGRISQVIVGDEQRQYLLVIGRDVDGVQLAQRLAQANEIVLSWNCWKLCEQYMFEVEIMREDEAVKVGGWSHPLKVLKVLPTTQGSTLAVLNTRPNQ